MHVQRLVNYVLLVCFCAYVQYLLFHGFGVSSGRGTMTSVAVDIIPTRVLLDSDQQVIQEMPSMEETLISYLPASDTRVSRDEQPGMEEAFITYSPDLLALMRDKQCLSKQCEAIYKYHDYPASLNRSLRALAGEERRDRHWVDSDVLDLKDGVIGGEGDVMLCLPPSDEVGDVIGSFGCNENAPQLSDYSCRDEALDSLPVHERVIVISQMWGYGYFHVMLEGLPRVMSAFHYLGKEQDVVGAGWEVHSMMRGPLADEMASFFGVKNFVGGRILARRLLVPLPTECGGGIAGINTVRLRDFVRSRISLTSVKAASSGTGKQVLVVIKRSGGYRSLSNHENVLELCKKLWRGGSVVEHTGSGSFQEQLELFYTASAVIGPHGAGLANAVGMRKGATMLEVLPDVGSNRLNVCYSMLAFTLGLRYFALGAPGFDSNGVGTVDLHALSVHPFWQQQV